MLVFWVFSGFNRNLLISSQKTAVLSRIVDDNNEPIKATI